MRLEGRCTCCGEPAAPSTRKNAINGKSNLCERHQLIRREYFRQRAGNKRRNMSAASYRVEHENALVKTAGS